MVCKRLLVAVAAPILAVQATFTSNCTNLVLHNGTAGDLDMLSASCTPDGSKTPVNSTLDLNLCLGVDYSSANLTWSIYGKFTEYCKDCTIVSPTELGCLCTTDDVTANSTINLNDGVVNNNGTLQCSW